MRHATAWFTGAQPMPRVAASVALGAGLGMLYAGSPAWLVWLALVLLLRTHVPSVLVGWLGGWVVGMIVSFTYVPMGRTILLGFEPFWRAVLVKPVICCFDLNQARTMGSLAAAIVAMAVAGAIAMAARFCRK